MTGEQFLDKVRRIEKITKISWEIKGKDSFDPDEVKVSVIADGEEISVLYPNPHINEPGSFNCYVSLCLIINKLMSQLKKDFTFYAEDDLADAVNCARKQLNG